MYGERISHPNTIERTAFNRRGPFALSDGLTKPYCYSSSRDARPGCRTSNIHRCSCLVFRGTLLNFESTKGTSCISTTTIFAGAKLVSLQNAFGSPCFTKRNGAVRSTDRNGVECMYNSVGDELHYDPRAKNYR